MKSSCNRLNKNPTTVSSPLSATNKRPGWMRAHKTANVMKFQFLNAVSSLHGELLTKLTTSKQSQ